MAQLQMGLLFLTNGVIFASKIIQNFSDSLQLSSNIEGSLSSSRLFLHMLTFVQIVILVMIFPAPILVGRKAMGMAIVSAPLISFTLTLFTMVFVDDWVQYIWIITALLSTLIASSICIRWYILYRKSEDETKRNHPICAILIMFGAFGTGFFSWPSLFIAFGFDVYGSGNFSFVSHPMQIALYFITLIPALTIFLVLATEIFVGKEQRDSVVLITAFGFFFLGLLNLVANQFANPEGEFIELWEFFVLQGSYGLIRPILFIYIVMRFNVIDLSDQKTRGQTRLIALLIATVWTSSLFEILQAFLPMPQLLSAAFIGAALAFGIGLEEKIFNRVASESLEIRLNIPEDVFEGDDLFRLFVGTLGVIFLLALAGLLGGVVLS